MSVAIVLASAGRPGLLAEVTANLASQSIPIAARIVSVPDAASLPDDLDPSWTVVSGVRGLAAQRNAGLEALDPSIEFVLFFDDDAVIRDDYAERAVRFFEEHPEIVGITGEVLADGAAHGRGEVSRDEATALLTASEGDPLTGAWSPSRTLYGCNFGYRRSAAPEIAFDDRLPLYSWLEDHDFARRLMRVGPLAHVDDCVIVHRGALSGGRTNHVRLGYSQLMNPVHLSRVGSFPLWLAAWEIFRPTAKNVARSLAGPERSWRRERLRGNLMAVGDVLRGRITPGRITEL